MKAFLFRELRPDCIVGGLSVEGGFQCWTLELPWRGNEPDISAIPEGVYSCGLRPSTKFGSHTNGMAYHIQPVQGRTDILIHYGNTAKDTKGCILVGESLAAGEPTFLQNSRKTLMALHAHTKGAPFTMVISSK